MNGTSNPAATLTAPQFVSDADGLDPTLILADMISAFEQVSGRTLYPAQVERLLINLYAYREALVRNAIQQAGLQNLLAYATYPALDYLGQLLDVNRLAAVAATCTLRFTLVNALTVVYELPAGTQVGTSDGNFIFASTATMVVQVGATTGTVNAACTVAGAAANGYLAGQVSVLIGGNALIASVTNTTETGGGSEIETDHHLRARIQQAPNQFSTAGPSGAYAFWAESASATITSAQVISPAPGKVSVYVLTGPVTIQPAASPNSVAIASSEILTAVENALNGETVRPLCDTVTAYAVTEVDYTIAATVTLFASAIASSTEAACHAAAVQLALDIAAGVQVDLVPSQWVTALSVDGVYEAVVTIAANIGGSALTPQPDGRFVLTSGQWGNCTAITISYGTTMENGPG